MRLLSKLSPAVARTPRPLRALRRDTRGATIVEYALVLSLIAVVVAPLLRNVGTRARESFQAAVAGFDP